MKSKSINDIISAFTLLIAFYQQYGYAVQTIHSDHENTILSAQEFLNPTVYTIEKTIAPNHNEKYWNDMFKKINARFRSVQSSMKFKPPNKLYAQLFTAVQQMINNMSYSTHPTLTLSIIFKGTKLDLNIQKLVANPNPFGSYAARHYTKRVDNKYQSHTDNGILLYLTNDTNSNIT